MPGLADARRTPRQYSLPPGPIDVLPAQYNGNRSVKPLSFFQKARKRRCPAPSAQLWVAL
jgi:hypothetical protein